MSSAWSIAISAAVLISFLHGVPAWIYALYSFSGALNSDRHPKWKDAIEKRPTFWKWVYCLHHALIYVVASMTGFSSLFLIVLILNNRVLVTAELNASKAAVLITLLFFAVAGISGALAQVLLKLDKFPGISAGGG